MAGLEVQVLSPEAVDRSPEVLGAWDALVSKSGDLRVLYQSRAWWECNRVVNEDKHYVAVVYADDGSVAGLCPLQRMQHPMSLEVFGHTLWRTRLNLIEVLGGVPLLPEDAAVHRQVLGALLERLPGPEGILLRNVRSDSFCWKVLRSPGLGSRALVYAPEGIGVFHWITLGSSPADYLAKFNRDTRNKLHRKVKKLRAVGNGSLELRRIESSEDVEPFLEAASAISEHTWQKRHLGIGFPTDPEQAALLRQCAQRGILRSYLLACGGDYCSFGLGYQFRDVYYYVQIGFDDRWIMHSPGTVQFMLVLEDLTTYRPASKVDFGHGDWEFKKRFGTDQVEHASVLLLRKGFRNRSRVALHAGTTTLVRGVKRLAGHDQEYRRPRDCAAPASEVSNGSLMSSKAPDRSEGRLNP